MNAGKMNAAVMALMAIVFVHGTISFADQWMPACQEGHFSAKQKHVLRTTPSKNRPQKYGHCMATLYKTDGDGEREMWSRNLINNISPVQVFVADSGKYVVTMDEWAGVGKLPVVIYNSKGGLVRVHGIDSLGLEKDWKHIKRSTVSYWWNEGSISFFGPDEETFFIRLHWGKLLLIQLQNGDLMDEEWYRIFQGKTMPKKKWRTLHEFGRTQIQKNAMQLLHSRDPKKQKTGVLVCGQEKLEESIPQLKKILANTKYPYVRKAAREALEGLGQRVDGAP